MKKETLKLVEDQQVLFKIKTEFSLLLSAKQLSYDISVARKLTKDKVVNLVAAGVEWLDREISKEEKGWIYVTSDSLSAIKYDAALQKLWVKFTSSDKVYSFAGVPQDIWDLFKSDKSKGSFFVKNIKGRYTDTLV